MQTVLYQKCSVDTQIKNENSCLLLLLFTFHMPPKARKSIDRERQNMFSCKHENTLELMEFLMLRTLFLLVTVPGARQYVNVI